MNGRRIKLMVIDPKIAGYLEMISAVTGRGIDIVIADFEQVCKVLIAEDEPKVNFELLTKPFEECFEIPELKRKRDYPTLKEGLRRRQLNRRF